MKKIMLLIVILLILGSSIYLVFFSRKHKFHNEGTEKIYDILCDSSNDIYKISFSDDGEIIVFNVEFKNTYVYNWDEICTVNNTISYFVKQHGDLYTEFDSIIIRYMICDEFMFDDEPMPYVSFYGTTYLYNLNSMTINTDISNLQLNDNIFLSDVEYLTIRNEFNGVVTIDLFEHFPNLKKITINENLIEDYEQLKHVLPNGCIIDLK